MRVRSGRRCRSRSAFRPVNFDPRSLDAKSWRIDRAADAAAGAADRISDGQSPLKGDRLPLPQNRAGSERAETLPQLQPINAPASQPVQPPAPGAAPRPKAAEQHDAAPRRCADGCCDRRIRRDASPTACRKAEAANAAEPPRAGLVRRSATLRAVRTPMTTSCLPTSRRNTGGRRDDPSGRLRAVRLALFPRRRCGGAQRAGLFRRRRPGFAHGLAAMGAGRGADPGRRRPSMPASSCRRWKARPECR